MPWQEARFPRGTTSVISGNCRLRAKFSMGGTSLQELLHAHVAVNASLAQVVYKRWPCVLPSCLTLLLGCV
jgi:hypothetical protein